MKCIILLVTLLSLSSCGIVKRVAKVPALIFAEDQTDKPDEQIIMSAYTDE